MKYFQFKWSDPAGNRFTQTYAVSGYDEAVEKFVTEHPDYRGFRGFIVREVIVI